MAVLDTFKFRLELSLIAVFVVLRPGERPAAVSHLLIFATAKFYVRWFAQMLKGKQEQWLFQNDK